MVRAAERCALGSCEEAALLKNAVIELNTWLESREPLPLWLPSMDLEATLTVPRRQLLRLSGNQSKHNLARLTKISRLIREMLKEHGHVVPAEAIPLALEDFKETLNENFFLYHATWIVELLNEVRWGIHEYLLPTFTACYEPPPHADAPYRYTFPVEVVQPLAQEWFWRLMNLVRRGPNVARFLTPSFLKRPKRSTLGA